MYDILRNEEKFKKFKAKKEDMGLIKATKTNKKVEFGWFDKFDNASCFVRNVRRVVQ